MRDLDQVAGILERAQKGQRLAQGMSITGETEEAIRAQSPGRDPAADRRRSSTRSRRKSWMRRRGTASGGGSSDAVPDEEGEE